MTTGAATRTRQTVQAYHQARFSGDVPAAAAQLAGTFTFQSPLISSGDANGHLAGLTGFLQTLIFDATRWHPIMTTVGR